VPLGLLAGPGNAGPADPSPPVLLVFGAVPGTLAPLLGPGRICVSGIAGIAPGGNLYGCSGFTHWRNEMSQPARSTIPHDPTAYPAHTITIPAANT